MLKIRLKRTGKKHEPHYRIVIAEARSRRDGDNVTEIGSWHPKENKLTLDNIKYREWIKKGAQPTEAVKKLADNNP